MEINQRVQLVVKEVDTWIRIPGYGQMGNLTVVQVGERVATEAQTKFKQLQGNISQGNFDSIESLCNRASQAYRGAVDQRSRGYSVKRSNYRF